jgi:hypothetical protein
MTLAPPPPQNLLTLCADLLFQPGIFERSHERANSVLPEEKLKRCGKEERGKEDVVVVVKL